MVIYCALALVSLLSVIAIKAEAKTSRTIKLECETALLTPPAQSVEDLYSLYDAVEREAYVLSSQLSEAENEEIRIHLEEMSDLVLRGAPAGQVKTYSYTLISSMRSLLKPDPATSARFSLSDILDEPELLRADVGYYTRHGQGTTEIVVFESQLMKEIKYMPLQLVRKFVGSIEKGFVPSLSGPGIYRLTNLGRDLVEVKIKGDGGHLRLMGCLENGVLRLKRLHTKHGSDGGQLNKYRHLCAS